MVYLNLFLFCALILCRAEVQALEADHSENTGYVQINFLILFSLNMTELLKFWRMRAHLLLHQGAPLPLFLLRMLFPLSLFLRMLFPLLLFLRRLFPLLLFHLRMLFLLPLFLWSLSDQQTINYKMTKL